MSQPQVQQKKFIDLKKLKKFEQKKKEQTMISQRRSKENA